MIGELQYQPVLNPITREIAQRAAALWNRHPDAVVVCEAELMREAVASAGVPSDRLLTALPQSRGHTTRLVAEWLRAKGSELPAGPWWMVTHALHAPRAAAVFAKCGLAVEPVAVDVPFRSDDPDWKLRSRRRFAAYNRAAAAYCWIRGWV